MVGRFEKSVAFNAAKLAAIRCDRAKPDLGIPRNQFVRNISPRAQLGQELADSSSTGSQFYGGNPRRSTCVAAANEQIVTMCLICLDRRGLVFQADQDRWSGRALQWQGAASVSAQSCVASQIGFLPDDSYYRHRNHPS